MNETNHTKFKKRAAALAVASCLSLTPWVAEAAGLGKLTVYSGLGQPLRAELDIGASREESAGMTARLAPPDAFKQAGIDYASALRDLRFSVEKRANGQSVVKVTSVKPVNEPFLDFLVELNWPTGRLVREYTFLLDPPEIASKGASAQVNVAEARVVDTVPGGSAAVDRPAKVRAQRPAPAPKVAAEPKKAESEGTHLVQTGETLRKIAAENQYDGVSLEQMLVGLFQNNPDAFIGKNINRLKAGAILNLPDKSSVEAIAPAEAKKAYVTQSSDWNAYRQKLASATARAPAREEAATQGATGKITAKVEDRAAPAEQGKDQVKVSRTELAAKGGASGKAAAASEVDAVAREKALKDAQERVALLEKNVGELQKLVDMKTQKLAELEKQAASKKEEPKPEIAKPVEPPKVAAPVAPVEPPKPAEPVKAPEPAKPAEEAKPVEPPPAPVKPAEKPAEPAKPVAPPAPSPKPAPAPVVEEPGFLDSLLSDPLPLIGGGGILALLAGYFMVKRRREQNASLDTTAAPSPSSLGPNSVFRMTGGQSVDTGNTPPQTGDFSQTGPGTIDTDEVDPVAEADVYMAYGRDSQAEEILLEALQKDPQRTAIHAKLLEIYANRKSVKQFETLAGELYAQTGGAGAEWEKVAALGAVLDPSNPLYSGARGLGAFDPDKTLEASPESLVKATVAMPGVLSQLVENAASESALSVEPTAEIPELPEATDTQPLPKPAQEPDDLMSLDFDLGAPPSESLPEITSVQDLSAEPYVDTLVTADANALDFDLGDTAPPAEEPVGELHVSDDLAVDFDFGSDSKPVSTHVEHHDLAEAHDFSPEGTMVMPLGSDSAVTTFVGLDGDTPASVGAEKEEASLEDTTVDFQFDVDSPSTQTLVNPLAENDAASTVVNPQAMQQYDFEAENPELANTVVNPNAMDAASLDFDMKLTDSVFLGQPMMSPDFDIGSINLDLSSDPVATVVAPPEAIPAAPESVAPTPSAAPELARDNRWEEVNTKLDLAKAYEEMGDLEGARELLQEVVGEGPTDLVEQANAILARIGE